MAISDKRLLFVADKTSLIRTTTKHFFTGTTGGQNDQAKCGKQYQINTLFHTIELQNKLFSLKIIAFFESAC
jgi:hypothetical protein